MKKETFCKTLSINSFYPFILFLILISLLTGCESRKIIVNALDEKEANEILVFLSTKGIDANKVQAASDAAGGAKAILWNISVDSSQSNEAMALLNQVGLPRRRGQNLLGLFSNVGLVPSGMQDKVKYQAGLAEQIAGTIRKIDGVLDADVQISFPEEDPLNPTATKQKITSSVYVKHSGILDDPNSHLISRIKRLVSSSINGLDYDNVTVIGDRARFSDTSSFLSSLGEEAHPNVHVWSISLAKESVTRFQIIFFLFILTFLLLFLSLAWLMWKFYSLLRKIGLKKFFSFHPLDVDDFDSLSEKTTVKDSKEKIEKKEPAEKESSKEDKIENN
jgi:type III secretion protein J